MPRVTYGEPKHACPNCNHLMIGRSDPEYNRCRCSRVVLAAQARAQAALLQSAMRTLRTVGH